ncbi:MAG: RNA polymerase sigma factor [Parvibaculaceae bacterium]
MRCCPGKFHVSSSAQPFRRHRPPFTVSSGAHNCPVDAFETAREEAPPTSLDETFRTERRALLRYLGRRAGHDAAPDLVQEVFVRAAGSAQASRLVNPAAFVRRIARNLLIDRARRRESNNNIVVFPLDEQRDVSVPPEQTLNLEAADLLRIYEQAVNDLPEKTRRVLMMSRDDELTYSQISEQLGISMATVQYHMVRAIAIVAAAVKDHR